MSRHTVRTGLALLGLLTIVAIALAALYLRPLPVEVAEPSGPLAVEVFGLGTVEARILSKIGFEVGAALVELNSDHGKTVKQGEVLARLHDGEQAARLARARAGVLEAKSALRRAEASVDRARAVLAQRGQTNQRQQALAARETVSVEEAEEAQLEEDVAAADLAVAISEVEVARARLRDASAQAELESVLLEHHVLRAPYDALVVERHCELGTVLSPGEPIFTLVDPKTVWALAYVDEARAGGIEVGQPAEVRLRSLPTRRFPGHVARIDIESDRVSEERRVYVACDRCPEPFHLGEQAEVFIQTAVLENALLVPEIAVEEIDADKGRVWTVEEGVLHQRSVRFGHRTLDARLEIRSGLPEGARVVTVLRPGLREGRSVRLVRESSP